MWEESEVKIKDIVYSRTSEPEISF